ncbi:hypothetical protein [Cupriavidus sp. D39]|uniref:hypothetical protein n=1 Tax=Cupriavidus sp. D39 TaxID=2997877 RepID=UPI002271D248|nr:hypothetical protein [Cupriavidus sp. D39]MCY0858686.1 hypothetical protein [Cupriavidus sp. D39]
MTDQTFLPLLGPILPELTDADAAAILDYLHELVMLVESHYLVQIRRHAESQLQLADQLSAGSAGVSTSITIPPHRDQQP